MTGMLILIVVLAVFIITAILSVIVWGIITDKARVATLAGTSRTDTRA